MTQDEITERLKPYLPIRVVLCIENDQIHGLTELSFAMGTDLKRVNVFWSGKAYSILGEHELDGVSWATENWKPGRAVIDPLAPDSPVDVDWAAWLDAVTTPGAHKFNKRNAPFTAKPNAVEALLASIEKAANAE